MHHLLLQRMHMHMHVCVYVCVCGRIMIQCGGVSEHCWSEERASSVQTND